MSHISLYTCAHANTFVAHNKMRCTFLLLACIARSPEALFYTSLCFVTSRLPFVVVSGHPDQMLMHSPCECQISRLASSSACSKLLLLLSYSTLTSLSIHACLQVKQAVNKIPNQSSYLNRGKRPKTLLPKSSRRSYGITTVT